MKTETKKRAKKPKYSLRTLRVYSRHPSHDVLRGKILLPKLTLIRLGSQTVSREPGIEVEINSQKAVANSANKRLMKECFTSKQVKTAQWWSKAPEPTDEMFPMVAKHLYGSRGTGNTLLNSIEEYKVFIDTHDKDMYIYERFYPFSREYRLHVTEKGCFYACRKMLKSETPEDKRWFRNDSNSIWVTEFKRINNPDGTFKAFGDENPEFDKPVNWAKIEEECVKALKAVGLDIGACDVKVQSATKKNGSKREDVDFIVIEINSAPSFGQVTGIKYTEAIKQIVNGR